MGFIKQIFSQIGRLPILIKIILIASFIGLGYLGYTKLKPQANKTTYQTAKATKETLIVTLSGSGTVSSANSASVTTQTSGVVSKLYVKNGDTVISGDPIAEVNLDMDGQQRANQAYASYLGAKTSLDNARTSLYTLQSTLFTEWKTFKDIAENSTYTNSDGSPNTQNRELAQFISVNDDWLAAEAKYKTQQQVIAQAQTALLSSWASYQQASPIIYAPISGTISGLSLQVGSVLTSQTSSSGNSTSQRIANIKTDATPMAVISLSEVDVNKVHIDDKATLTLDAFSDKTFTGKVVSIDTTGTVSSGVTNYSCYIVFDTAFDGIYPNMAVTAKIITLVKNDVVLVPSSAVVTSNGLSAVRILVNGKLQEQPVEVGSSSDTETEIVSGINEGDTVITSVSTGSTSTTSSSNRSVFSSFGGGGAGGAIRMTGGR